MVKQNDGGRGKLFKLAVPRMSFVHSARFAPFRLDPPEIYKTLSATNINK